MGLVWGGANFAGPLIAGRRDRRAGRPGRLRAPRGVLARPRADADPGAGGARRARGQPPRRERRSAIVPGHGFRTHSRPARAARSRRPLRRHRPHPARGARPSAPAAALPADAVAHVRQARARGAASVGGNHAAEHGGQGWSAFEQVLVQEELGRNTNGVWWNMGGGYNVLARGTDEQIRALPRADAARRARRRLRRHRGGRGLGPVRHRGHGRAHRVGLADPGREVVRDVGRRGRLRHPDGERRRRRRAAADAVPGRPRPARDRGRRRPAVHAHVPARPSRPCATTARSRRTPCWAARA